jgi:uncharacterized protein (DUF2062 family)
VFRRSLRRLHAATLRLWERAKNEHSTPAELALSVGVGVFAGCTPFYGLHMWAALGLATLFRLNRLWAFVGSRISFTPIFAWITFCEIEVAHRLRTGAWAPLAPRHVLDHARELLTDWMMGTLPVGLALGAVVAAVGYALARRVSRRSPGGPRPRSSECPPSAPPAPTP